MTFKPSLHHLGPFVGVHVFGRKYGDAWPGPWSRRTVTETTSAPQIQACAHYSSVPAFHWPSWTLEAALPRGSCAGSLSSDGEPESRALNVFLVQCQHSRF